jgi:ATP-dependent DNA helicase DinG
MAKSAEELLIYLFDEILPKHGMNLRVKQKELSLEMLRALQANWLYVRRKWGQEKLTHISLH